MTKRKSILEKWGFKQTPYENKVAAIYVRVSSDEFKKNSAGVAERRASVTTQIKDLTTYAENHGWKHQLYDADCDISGGDEIEDRPAMQQMIADIQTGKVHTVICREMKRIFRNELAQQQFVYKVLLPCGCDLQSPFERIDIKTHDGRRMLGLKGSEAQGELIYTAEQSIRGKQEVLEEGKLRTTPPYGYGIQEVNGVRFGYQKPNEASLISEVFQRAAEGEGAQVILQSIIDRKIKPKRGKNWHGASIIRWLRNPIYKGTCRYNGKEYCPSYRKLRLI